MPVMLNDHQIKAVYKFLKEPLIRKYGKEWFKQLEQSAKLKLKK
jgi:hypothetical protein